MKLVVADASPIHYLVLVAAVHVLPKLSAKVIVPAHIVARELQSPRTPARAAGDVRLRISDFPRKLSGFGFRPSGFGFLRPPAPSLISSLDNMCIIEAQ